MFIETIVYKQIKIKSTSAPLGSTLTTTTYVIKICAFIPEKKRVDRSGLVTTIAFFCARAQRMPPKFCTSTRFLFYGRRYCSSDERIMLHGRVTLFYSLMNI